MYKIQNSVRTWSDFTCSPDHCLAIKELKLKIRVTEKCQLLCQSTCRPHAVPPFRPHYERNFHILSKYIRHFLPFRMEIVWIKTHRTFIKLLASFHNFQSKNVFCHIALIFVNWVTKPEITFGLWARHWIFRVLVARF